MANYRQEKAKGHPGIYKLLDSEGRWVSTKVYYRDSAGRQVTRSFTGKDTLTAAAKFKAEVTVEKGKGTLSRPPKAMTLQDLYDKVHETRSYAPKTVSLHETLWGDETRPRKMEPLKRRRFETISADEIRGILSKIEAPAMREKTRLLLSTLFNYAVMQGWLATNPAKASTGPTTRQDRIERGGKDAEKRYLSTDELARLLAQTPDRYRTLVHVMARVGLRPGEAFALRVGKFDPLRRTLLIDTSSTGFTKTGKSREVTLPGALADELVGHIARWSDPADPEALVFPSSERGTMIQANNFRRRVFGPAADRAGVNHGLRVNDLRHTAVSWAIGLGADVYSVQRMVGHSKPSITLDVYGSWWDAAQQQLAEQMDAAIRSEEVAVEGKVEGKVVQLR